MFCSHLSWTRAGRFLPPAPVVCSHLASFSCCVWMSNVLLLFPPIMGSVLSPLLSSLLPISLTACRSLSLSLQLIIGFESGIVVLWDLKSKKADYRYTYDEVGKISPHCLFFSNSFSLLTSDRRSVFLIQEPGKLITNSWAELNTAVRVCVWGFPNNSHVLLARVCVRLSLSA